MEPRETIAFAERANRIPWPPILYAGVLAGACALHWLARLDWFGCGWGWGPIGAVIALAGIGIGVAGFMRFRALGSRSIRRRGPRRS